jgi:hypothetical protein
LSSHVAHAYQALAIDEKRFTFQPTLWKKQEGSGNQVLEQVWFVGVHSNIGGGYPSTELSDITFQWMAQKLQDCSLDLKDISSHPKPFGELMESWKCPDTVVQWLLSYRAIGKLSDSNEFLNDSVLIRYNNKELQYHPKNLEEYLSHNSRV